MEKESENQEKEQVNVRFPLSTLIDLDSYRSVTRETRSDIIVRAVSDFLKKQKGDVDEKSSQKPS